MSHPTYAANPIPVEPRTLTDLFLEAVDRFGDAPAFGRIGPGLEVEHVSYADVLDLTRRVAAGLAAEGLSRGDRVAILSHNRLEWALTDYGALCAGVVVVPIYPTLTARQVAQILRDSETRLVFVQDADLVERALEACAHIGADCRIVVFEALSGLPDSVRTWDAFMEDGGRRAGQTTEEAFRAEALRADTEDVATMIYTSGTTGEPKGVMLTHRNVASNVIACGIALQVTEEDSTVSFLPLSHILQRTVDYLFFTHGCRIAHARSMLTAVDDMKLVRPTVVVAVPRVFEKIHGAVMEAKGLKKAIIDWAVDVADRMAGLRLQGRAPSGFLSAQFKLADRLVFSKVRAAVGGRVRLFVSGSAPLSPDLNRFFYSIGLTIVEGYGLTETSPVTNVNTLRDFRIGTVGKPVPGTEIRIAEDGEILVRGPQVMKGYHGMPEATAEAVDADGWFHTGDVGELDEDGFLTITDRKKDLIVTAGGKNVAPQPVENRLKSSPFIEQAVMVGDRRKFPSVLIVPSFEAVEPWARERGLTWSDRDELLDLPEVREHLEAEVRRGTRDLASYETPKKIAFIAEEFTIGNGSLTPTLKVKRSVIQERFKALIDELYVDDGERGH
ncbi:MAG TPA: long-chain fatty acid--CoA ligase [Longimicrobiales bacterium]|nr:long-chain fatty acid--CoA ligase [Longimicrobiales bacterium]